MTTIATDGKTMAADRLTTAGSERVAFIDKVKRAKDGRIFACAGRADEGALFTRWIDDPSENPTLSDDFIGAVLTPDGKCLWYGDKLEPVEYMIPMAFGSGDHLAIGAMLAGATPEQAVLIAQERDTRSGGGVTAMSIEPPT